MKKAKCLICNSEVPWWKKLSSNNRVGIECRTCHSIMKHPNHAVWISFGFILLSAICIGNYEFDLSSMVFIVGWVFFVGMAVLIMGRAKLELVYENKHRAKNT